MLDNMDASHVTMLLMNIFNANNNPVATLAMLLLSALALKMWPRVLRLWSDLRSRKNRSSRVRARNMTATWQIKSGVCTEWRLARQQRAVLEHLTRVVCDRCATYPEYAMTEFPFPHNNATFATTSHDGPAVAMFDDVETTSRNGVSENRGVYLKSWYEDTGPNSADISITTLYVEVQVDTAEIESNEVQRVASAFIDRAVAELDERSEYDLRDPHVFLMESGDHVDRDAKGRATIKNYNDDECPLTFKAIPLKTKCSFANKFFEGKEELVRDLERFKNGADGKYDKVGMKWNYHVMLRGTPGSGKTTLAKAIAKHFNLHMVIINPSFVRTTKTLESLFFDDFKAGYKIDPRRVLFVLDDADRSAWAPILLAPHHRSSLSRELGPLEFTQEAFLNVLDGIVEREGHLMVSAINRPFDHMDAAVLRKGRTDKCLEINQMPKSCVNDMYTLWFDEPLPSSVLDNMRDYQFTQADLGSLFMSQDKDRIIRELSNGRCHSGNRDGFAAQVDNRPRHPTQQQHQQMALQPPEGKRKARRFRQRAKKATKKA